MMESTLNLLPLAMIAAAMMFGAAPVFAQSSPGSPPADTPAPTKISGPFTHENLSVYFIHGPSADGPVPLTLSEALAKKLFKVHETGNVQSLAMENLGDDAVFLQAGDIVKGGQQDRVLTMSVLVPPKSGKMPISAYCVEQGRWAARGAESVKTFDSSAAYMPSKRAKLAMMATEMPAAAPAAPAGLGAAELPGRIDRGQRVGGATAPNRQQEMWASVAETQDKLSANLGAKVAAPQSASSLQLALENTKLAETKAAFVKAVSGPAKDAGDVIGFAFAVNGQINSADVYPSHALFGKMWGKLIDAAATEAISAKTKVASDVKPAPTADQITAFLATTASAAPDEQKLDANTIRLTRQNAAAVSAETKARDGRTLHRSYVAF